MQVVEVEVNMALVHQVVLVALEVVERVQAPMEVQELLAQPILVVEVGVIGLVFQVAQAAQA